MAPQEQDTVNATAPSQDYAALRHLDLPALRQEIRSGRYRGQTAGLASGRLQCNLVILSERYALDFLRFCQRNPKACPLVGVSETGDPWLRTLGRDIDVRSDLPGYTLYRDGRESAQLNDITAMWQDDFVAFALGCSFSFERALIEAGIALRHIEQNKTVPMFRTNIESVPAGPFSGGLVVSMRPIKVSEVERARAISRRYPQAHGGPLHVGAPEAIGIADVARPDWGDSIEVLADETPVFWACGVTPQNAVTGAGLPLCITHTPGRMLITDVDASAEVPVLSQSPQATERET